MAGEGEAVSSESQARAMVSRKTAPLDLGSASFPCTAHMGEGPDAGRLGIAKLVVPLVVACTCRHTYPHAERSEPDLS